jgi:hypothetical protein
MLCFRRKLWYNASTLDGQKEDGTMAKTDEQAPVGLLVEIKDPASGQVWGLVTLQPKQFSTGSKGFHAGTKLVNPNNPEARYQCNLQMILIGSKE